MGGALLLVIVLLVLVIIIAVMVVQKKKATVKTFQDDVLARLVYIDQRRLTGLLVSL